MPPPLTMFGSIGGVFSAFDLMELRRLELDLCFADMDLGRRFRIDEAEMLPRNRVSELASALLLGLIVKKKKRFEWR